ncbi:MAG: CHAT domain-containing protein [Proteobacteria bacterium]|nr:CHAT domain-containing protein [Pseudomonadota bacterium]
MPSPRRALTDLLTSMFDQRAMRNVVRAGPHGEQIWRHMPDPSVSRAAMADQVIDQLEQHGGIDDSFWRHLITERPGRKADILGVQALWTDRGSEPEPDPITPEPVASQDRQPDSRKILFLSANPDPDSPLAVDAEYRRIRTRLEATTHRHRIDLVSWPDVHTVDLATRLRRELPDIVHFSGHGGEDGSLRMRNKHGEPHWVDPTAVARFIARRSQAIRMVVLNACYSQALADLLCRDIECTIGMSTVVTDRAAVTFAETFYEALWDGDTIQNAFGDSVDAILAEGSDEQDIAQLTIKPGLRASDLRLF